MRFQPTASLTALASRRLKRGPLGDGRVMNPIIEYFVRFFESSPITAILVLFLVLVVAIVSFWISEKYTTVKTISRYYDWPDSGPQYSGEEIVKEAGPVSCTCSVLGILALIFACFLLFIAWSVFSDDIISAFEKPTIAVVDIASRALTLIVYGLGALIVLILVFLLFVGVLAFFDDLIKNWPFSKM